MADDHRGSTLAGAAARAVVAVCIGPAVTAAAFVVCLALLRADGDRWADASADIANLDRLVEAVRAIIGPFTPAGNLRRVFLK